MKNNTRSKSRVLVVDDNQDNLQLITGMLEDGNYRVSQAMNGSAALTTAEEDSPDVVLMDINMPEMDGFEACRAMKRREDLADVPVIFLSALGETVDKVHGFEAGGVDYITKPFSIEEVEARIDTHVTIRRLRAESQERFNELKKLEGLRDKLTHMIVHDMRNPLGVIMAALDFTIRDPADLNPRTVQMLELARNQSNFIDRMINDMLDVSRLENKELVISPENCDLGKIIDDAIESVPLMGQTLTVEAPDTPTTVHCDGDLVRRVVSNLIGNAVKFTPADGEIRLTAKAGLREIRVEVQDPGMGIPAEFQEKVFEKFNPAEERQNRKAASTGLGLTFCRLVVEAHSGHIGLNSTSDAGTVFWFSLPV